MGTSPPDFLFPNRHRIAWRICLELRVCRFNAYRYFCSGCYYQLNPYNSRSGIPHCLYTSAEAKPLSVNTQTPTHTHTLSLSLSGYYGLSLFNSCSLNAPDNDKAPQSLTASLLTLSLLSLSASHSRPSLLRFVSIVWHSRTIWRRPEPPLKHPYSSQTKTCEREREKYQLGEKKKKKKRWENNLQKPWNVRYHSPLTGNIKLALMETTLMALAAAAAVI